jgi:hypothetical protein
MVSMRVIAENTVRRRQILTMVSVPICAIGIGHCTWLFYVLLIGKAADHRVLSCLLWALLIVEVVIIILGGSWLLSLGRSLPAEWILETSGISSITTTGKVTKLQWSEILEIREERYSLVIRSAKGRMYLPWVAIEEEYANIWSFIRGNWDGPTIKCDSHKESRLPIICLAGIAILLGLASTSATQFAFYTVVPAITLLLTLLIIKRENSKRTRLVSNQRPSAKSQATVAKPGETS